MTSFRPLVVTITLLSFSIFSFTLLAQETQTNQCIDIVNGRPEIKNEVFDKLAEIFAERICQIDLSSCQLSQSYLNYEPTEEELQAALAEEALLNPDQIISDEENPIAIPADNNGSSPINEGIKNAVNFTTDTSSRTVYNATVQGTEKAIEVLVSMSAARLARTQLSQVVRARISRVRAKIRVHRLTKRLSQIGREGLSITTNIKSIPGVIAMVGGLTALEFIKKGKEAAYIGNCTNNKRSTGSQLNLSDQGYVKKEQFFTWDGDAIGECFPSLSYHSGLLKFNNDVKPERQIELLSGEDPLLCQNIHDVHARITTKPKIQITSCNRRSRMRLSLGDSQYKDILGNELTITGHFLPKEPKITRIYLMGQSTTGRACRMGSLLPLENKTAFWVDPNLGDACVSRSNNDCAQLWFLDPKLIPHRFGSKESKEDLEDQCLRRSMNLTCSEGFDAETLTNKVLSSNACGAERYVKHQTDLIRALHSTITRSTACCRAYGSKAILSDSGECLQNNNEENEPQRFRSGQ